ncbi:ATP-binding protein [Brevibacterium sp. FME17]|uniref:ATP-binding protein n=1 Tax=Brevibacterium sp. FME17 TaxID=2742606 RepID=UPI0018668B75|nr:DUF4143 domain-containing protein [Brevibacterium sp. FME17]
MADHDRVTEVPEPVLIDEWQLVPEAWERVRTAVDNDPHGGRFLLAGSAEVAPGLRMHSGAGRIVSMTMRPLSFYEREICAPTVSLAKLLRGKEPDIKGHSSVRLAQYTDEILKSGFPGIRALPERARRIQLDSYVSRIVEEELPENGMQVRRPETLRAWMAAYGAATSNDANYTEILNAATAGEPDKPSRTTVNSYRDHLQRLFVLDPLPAWIPTFNPLKRLTKTPKYQLVDPAIAARLVGVGNDGLLNGEGQMVSASTGTWLGSLFESLVTQSVRVYASAADAQVGHLRTRDTQREIDLIVEGEDRQVVAIEVKLAATVGDKDVRHLNWLKGQIGERLAGRVVITTGEEAYLRRDGVAVIPFSLLGP